MNAWKSLGIPDSDSGFLGYKQMQRFQKDPDFEVNKLLNYKKKLNNIKFIKRIL